MKNLKLILIAFSSITLGLIVFQNCSTEGDTGFSQFGTSAAPAGDGSENSNQANNEGQGEGEEQGQEEEDSTGSEPVLVSTAQRFTVSVAMLTSLHDQCNAGNLTSIFCNAAVDRYCRMTQDLLAGLGVVNYTDASNVDIGCATADGGMTQMEPFATIGNQLPGFEQFCNEAIEGDSIYCQAGIGRICRSNYASEAGFGANQATAQGNFQFVCLSGLSAKRNVVNLSDLQAINSGCLNTDLESLACKEASDKYCRDNDYLLGYGIVEYDSTTGNSQIICVNEAYLAAAD